MKPGPKPKKATCGHDQPNFGRGMCRRCYHRDHARRKYRTKAWPAHLKRKYGITVEALEEMKARQGGKCAICKRAGELHVDHSHMTGEVRGLLCGKCNRGLGMFGESFELLLAAIGYLAKEKAA